MRWCFLLVSTISYRCRMLTLALNLFAEFNWIIFVAMELSLLLHLASPQYSFALCKTFPNDWYDWIVFARKSRFFFSMQILIYILIMLQSVVFSPFTLFDSEHWMLPLLYFEWLLLWHEPRQTLIAWLFKQYKTNRNNFISKVYEWYRK